MLFDALHPVMKTALSVSPCQNVQFAIRNEATRHPVRGRILPGFGRQLLPFALQAPPPADLEHVWGERLPGKEHSASFKNFKKVNGNNSDDM